MCHRPDISTIFQSKTDISTIYRSTPISCRTSPISDISKIYRRIYRIFASLGRIERERTDIVGYEYGLCYYDHISKDWQRVWIVRDRRRARDCERIKKERNREKEEWGGGGGGGGDSEARVS